MDESRGQSIVEMAVLVPFLVLLILAIFEMSQVFSAYIALINAAREGATYASRNPELSDPAKAPVTSQLYEDYVDRVKAEVVAAGLLPSELTIDRPVAPQILAVKEITVTIHYKLRTFSSTMSMPLLGRMGLQDYYQVDYSVVFPIREVP